MKRLVAFVILMIVVISCSEADIALREDVKREMKERGHGCYRDPYSKSGHIVCGYRR